MHAWTFQQPTDGSAEEEIATVFAGLTLEELIVAGCLLVAAVLAGIAASRLTRWAVSKQNNTLAPLLGRIAGGIVFAFMFVYALNSVGIAVTPILGALGVGGFAIAFALQDILQNLVAGVILQLRRPFHVGDRVILGEYFGTIDEITLRTVDMTTVDGEKVILPAAQVLQNPIENWTTNGRRRTDIVIGVDYETDIAAASEGIRDAINGLDVVLETPPTKVIASEFGDSSVNLRILAWHSMEDHFLDVHHAVVVAAKHWCDENGVGIPFPIRAVQLRDPDTFRDALSN